MSDNVHHKLQQDVVVEPLLSPDTPDKRQGRAGACRASPVPFLGFLPPRNEAPVWAIRASEHLMVRKRDITSAWFSSALPCCCNYAVVKHANLVVLKDLESTKLHRQATRTFTLKRVYTWACFLKPIIKSLSKCSGRQSAERQRIWSHFRHRPSPHLIQGMQLSSYTGSGSAHLVTFPRWQLESWPT